MAAPTEEAEATTASRTLDEKENEDVSGRGDENSPAVTTSNDSSHRSSSRKRGGGGDSRGRSKSTGRSRDQDGHSSHSRRVGSSRSTSRHASRGPRGDRKSRRSKSPRNGKDEDDNNDNNDENASRRRGGTRRRSKSPRNGVNEDDCGGRGGTRRRSKSPRNGVDEDECGDADTFDETSSKMKRRGSSRGPPRKSASLPSKAHSGGGSGQRDNNKKGSLHAFLEEGSGDHSADKVSSDSRSVMSGASGSVATNSSRVRGGRRHPSVSASLVGGGGVASSREEMRANRRSRASRESSEYKSPSRHRSHSDGPLERTRSHNRRGSTHSRGSGSPHPIDRRSLMQQTKAWEPIRVKSPVKERIQDRNAEANNQSIQASDHPIQPPNRAVAGAAETPPGFPDAAVLSNDSSIRDGNFPKSPVAVKESTAHILERRERRRKSGSSGGPKRSQSAPSRRSKSPSFWVLGREEEEVGEEYTPYVPPPPVGNRRARHQSSNRKRIGSSPKQETRKGNENTAASAAEVIFTPSNDDVPPPPPPPPPPPAPTEPLATTPTPLDTNSISYKKNINSFMKHMFTSPGKSPGKSPKEPIKEKRKNKSLFSKGKDKKNSTTSEASKQMENLASKQFESFDFMNSSMASLDPSVLSSAIPERGAPQISSIDELYNPEHNDMEISVQGTIGLGEKLTTLNQIASIAELFSEEKSNTDNAKDNDENNGTFDSPVRDGGGGSIGLGELSMDSTHLYNNATAAKSGGGGTVASTSPKSGSDIGDAPSSPGCLRRQIGQVTATSPTKDKRVSWVEFSFDNPEDLLLKSTSVHGTDETVTKTTAENVPDIARVDEEAGEDDDDSERDLEPRKFTLKSEEEKEQSSGGNIGNYNNAKDDAIQSEGQSPLDGSNGEEKAVSSLDNNNDNREEPKRKHPSLDEAFNRDAAELEASKKKGNSDERTVGTSATGNTSASEKTVKTENRSTSSSEESHDEVDPSTKTGMAGNRSTSSPSTEEATTSAVPADEDCDDAGTPDVDDTTTNVGESATLDDSSGKQGSPSSLNQSSGDMPLKDENSQSLKASDEGSYSSSPSRSPGRRRGSTVSAGPADNNDSQGRSSSRRRGSMASTGPTNHNDEHGSPSSLGSPGVSPGVGARARVSGSTSQSPGRRRGQGGGRESSPHHNRSRMSRENSNRRFGAGGKISRISRRGSSTSSLDNDEDPRDNDNNSVVSNSSRRSSSGDGPTMFLSSSTGLRKKKSYLSSRATKNDRMSSKEKRSSVLSSLDGFLESSEEKNGENSEEGKKSYGLDGFLKRMDDKQAASKRGEDLDFDNRSAHSDIQDKARKNRIRDKARAESVGRRGGAGRRISRSTLRGGGSQHGGDNNDDDNRSVSSAPMMGSSDARRRLAQREEANRPVVNLKETQFSSKLNSLKVAF